LHKSNNKITNINLGSNKITNINLGSNDALRNGTKASQATEPLTEIITECAEPINTKVAYNTCFKIEGVLKLDFPKNIYYLLIRSLHENSCH
jgi:hypothetical protein